MTAQSCEGCGAPIVAGDVRPHAQCEAEKDRWLAIYQGQWDEAMTKIGRDFIHRADREEFEREARSALAELVEGPDLLPDDLRPFLYERYQLFESKRVFS